jgi:hypothetical protein
MIFQIKNDSDNAGLLKTVKCHGSIDSREYGNVITNSLKLFSEIGEDDGWDIDDIDDFVQFHNLRSVLIVERFFVEDEIQFYQ